MRKSLLDNKKVIEHAVNVLWQGKGANIDEIRECVIEVSNTILSMAEALGEEDRNTTAIYVHNALSDFKRSCDNRDDFMLADCLYYEWRELISIYLEIEEV